MFCPALGLRVLPCCVEEEKKEQVQLFSEGASVAVFLTLEVALRGFSRSISVLRKVDVSDAAVSSPC